MDLYLGIDCGTQGTKALLVDADGTVHGRGYAPHQLIERSTGAREQQPQWWVDALKTAVRAAIASAPPASTVIALGVSGQQHGLVILDANDEVIRPAKLWCDTETAPDNAALIARFGGQGAFFTRFGIVPLTGYTVSKLVWLAEHEPAGFARIRHILLPHEYLNFWLTGTLAAEPGDASGTAFFNPNTRQWTHEILSAIDGNTGQLAAALPPLIASDAIVGTLRPEVAASLGLPPACLVSAGGGDNMMGAIGTANVREGVVTISLGTSATVYSFSESAPSDPTGCVAPFCSSSGGWLPLVCTMNATNVVTATAELLGRKVQTIDQALDATSPGADGLVFLPFLNGERTPDLPNAHGSLHGIASTNFTPDHLLRAAVEGVSFGILDGLNRILSGRSAETINVIGGGARSRAWRQLLADATGAAIHVPAEEESGCLGAAIQALVASRAHRSQPLTFAEAASRMVRTDTSSTCEPRPALRPSYDEARTAYRRELHRQHGV